MPLKQGALYIDGHWIPGEGSAFSSENPADGKAFWQGRMATKNEISAAVEAAKQAASAWAENPNRLTHLQQFGDCLTTRRQALTQLIAQESGKPRWEASTEVDAVLGKITLSIDAYQTRTADKHWVKNNITHHLRYKPLGVVAILGPFNFPAHLSHAHIIPALLAGNTVILKPSELTPAVAEFMIHCWHDSGLPKGVLNLLQGDRTVATDLLDHDLQGIYFTGSYHTGQLIHKHLQNRPEVMLVLEMGGNNPLLIDTPADLDAAVYHTLLSSFITAGQRCTAARRVLVPDTAFGDLFLEQLILASQRLSVGPYTEQPEPFMGPVISHTHATTHLQAQEALLAAGGQVLLPMKRLIENTGFLSPGLIDMTSVHQPRDEEIFAPLIQLYRYTDFEHALTLANQTRYGLSAGILTDNESHYQHFYKTIRAGLINWNRPTTGASSDLPFGGIGQSGNHRPSAYFAADYCAYPVAVLKQSTLSLPPNQLPGLHFPLQHP